MHLIICTFIIPCQCEMYKIAKRLSLSNPDMMHTNAHGSLYHHNAHQFPTYTNATLK
uniref:Uncharacterized protein n=1 Tax=Rhizophora mucronata TaxID=61149 RepID=A0A2P2QAY7_RHIMU